MDEAGLIQDALRGDLDAFNRLVLAYQDMAYNLAYRMLSDSNSAEDATQTAFISAYRHLKQYRGGSFRAWVLRMVTNTCYDELRRRQRHPSIPLEPINNDEEEEIESPIWLADHNPTPDEEIEARELEAAIQHCIQELPDEFRAVVILVDVQGMDYREVSQVVGKPLGTIKSRLARARMRLRECLAGFAELLPVQFRLGKEAELQ
ncbi:MAG: sigma-70 family RNA polymerase sigma factor [Chloroflexota bacterium]|jgi:RNA polymerase sigma-70 factor (ECF subfamily)